MLDQMQDRTPGQLTSARLDLYKFGQCNNVDKLIYDEAPWQLWKVFGAHFHALRMNALLNIGFKE
jgi:hypothetical protein